MLHSIKKFKMKNRLKKNETTFCRYTESGKEIKEGDLLEDYNGELHIVLYNKFTGCFEIIKYNNEFPFDAVEMHFYRKWKIVGSIDDEHIKSQLQLQDFDLNKEMERAFRLFYKEETK